MQKLVALTTAVLAVVMGWSLAWAGQTMNLPGDSSININSEFENEAAFSTAERPNANNFGRLSTAKNSLNFLSHRVESLVTLGLGHQITQALGVDSIRLFYHPRFYADTGFFFDRDLNHINEFTGDNRYEGNGFGLFSVGTDEWEYDTDEAYIDIRKGPLWIRAGKQIIEYGGGLLTRATNDVDSLDLRRNLIFDNLLTEFKDQEIGQWTLKGSYDFELPAQYVGQAVSEYATDNNLTAWISPDTQPSIFTAPGSALGVLPSFTDLQDADQITRAHHRLSWGAALKTTILGVDVTGLYFSTPEHLGQFYAAACRGAPAGVKPGGLFGFTFTTPGCIPGTPLRFNPDRGFPLFAAVGAPFGGMGIRGSGLGFNPAVLPAVRQARLDPTQVGNHVFDNFVGPAFFGPGGPSPQLLALAGGAFGGNSPDLQFVFDRHFPRIHTFAGQLSYSTVENYEGAAGMLLNGNQYRLDIAYKPQKKFTAASASFRGFSIGDLTVVGEIEAFKRFFAFQPQSTFIILEYYYDSAGDIFDDSLRQEGRSGGWHLWAAAAQQQFRNSTFAITDVFSTDSEGFGPPGFLNQSIIQYKPRSWLEFRAAYDYFGGSHENLFGRLTQFDQMITSVVLKF